MARAQTLPVDWIKNLPDNEKKDFESLVRNSRQVLGRLLQVIDEKLDLIEKYEDSSDSYNDGYPFRQAYENGHRKGLKEVRKLLEFLEV